MQLEVLSGPSRDWVTWPVLLEYPCEFRPWKLRDGERNAEAHEAQRRTEKTPIAWEMARNMHK